MRKYFAEFNRVIEDNIRAAARRLRRLGLRVTILSHKTALLIERPEGMLWADFTSAILAVLQPRRGSVMLSSETGFTFICNNAGNRPGQFQCQNPRRRFSRTKIRPISPISSGRFNRPAPSTTAKPPILTRRAK
jgi:hypothetical protein